jgi:hypothetical protein
MAARLSLLNLASNRRHAETQRFAPECGCLTGPSHECRRCTGNTTRKQYKAVLEMWGFIPLGVSPVLPVSTSESQISKVSQSSADYKNPWLRLLPRLVLCNEALGVTEPEASTLTGSSPETRLSA